MFLFPAIHGAIAAEYWLASPLLNSDPMKVADTVELEPRAQAQRLEIPAGILGLEHIKEYELIANPAEEPFMWLQSAGVPDVAFLLISPFLVMPEYRPDISDNDSESLGLRGAQDAQVFNIVTVRGASAATVNLKGPIILNRHTNTARQVVLNNAADYSVRHPIVIP
ncbi:MAG TPA: flagellar assembly protein FliW [Candidatus Acidoferrum sp.]|nr:flagellar assembly protein FliW [Candidatus Acidoferrum sp.]